MLLSAAKNEQTICEISDVELLYRPTYDQIDRTLNKMLDKAGCGLSDIDAVMTGLSTHADNDKVYFEVIENHFGDRPILCYKHLFGESFSASAIGTYAAMTCLRNGRIPSFLRADINYKKVNPVVTSNNAMPADNKIVAETATSTYDTNAVKRILVYNHHSNKPHSFILLSSC